MEEVQVVADGLVERLLGAELHSAGKQHAPLPADQNRVGSEGEVVRDRQVLTGIWMRQQNRSL